MPLPLIASLIIKKGLGKHIILRASARGHLGASFKLGRARIGVMANKAHTHYISRVGKRWYLRRRL